MIGDRRTFITTESGDVVRGIIDRWVRQEGLVTRWKGDWVECLEFVPSTDPFPGYNPIADLRLEPDGDGLRVTVFPGWGMLLDRSGWRDSYRELIAELERLCFVRDAAKEEQLPAQAAPVAADVEPVIRQREPKPGPKELPPDILKQFVDGYLAVRGYMTQAEYCNDFHGKHGHYRSPASLRKYIKRALEF